MLKVISVILLISFSSCFKSERVLKYEREKSKIDSIVSIECYPERFEPGYCQYSVGDIKTCAYVQYRYSRQIDCQFFEELKKKYNENF